MAAPSMFSATGHSSVAPRCFSQRQTEPLFAVEYLRRMRGGSQSHLMRCSDDNYYVVKFQNNPQGRRILVNEMLGTRLAAHLGLPTVPTQIIDVHEALIRWTPDLCVELSRNRIPCQPGLNFGSRYPRDPGHAVFFDFLPDKQLSEVNNVGDFVGMLIFDKWTCNLDGRQTIFWRSINGRYETVMTDQGLCFGGQKWNFPDAPLRGLYCRLAVYDQVRGMIDFEPWLTRLETQINADTLIDLVKDIPSEWYDSDEDSLQRLLEQLDLRRSRVRGLLWETRNARPYAFPNWIEGIQANGRSTNL